MTTKIYRCKLHDHAHPYTVCPLCACQYCPQYWATCPRTSWHPTHATTDADRGRRDRELEEGRSQRS